MEKIINLISLGVSIAGFYGYITSNERKTKYILLVAIIVILGLLGVNYYDNVQNNKAIEKTKEEIMRVIGSNNPMSFEQIYSQLYYKNYSVAEKALDELVDTHFIDHRKINVTSLSGKIYEVRVFNMNGFPID